MIWVSGAVSLATVIAVVSSPVVDGRLSDGLLIKRDIGCGYRRTAREQRPQFLRKAQSQISFKRLQVRSDVMHIVVLERHGHEPGVVRADRFVTTSTPGPRSITWLCPSSSTSVMRKSLTWVTRPEIVAPSAVFTVAVMASELSADRVGQIHARCSWSAERYLLAICAKVSGRMARHAVGGDIRLSSSGITHQDIQHMIGAAIGYILNLQMEKLSDIL